MSFDKVDLLFKVYKLYLNKIFIKIIIKYKKNVLHKYSFARFNPFTLNIDCICKLLYMIVSHYHNKTLYNRLFFGTIFTDFLMLSGMHKTHPEYNNEN